ncbi:MAG: T9SS type A sorting domain-containing protein [Chitinophagales bacterium]|nr:T9SS type A sorting domain-containing protein [Chitinophagales bacterium]
MRHLKAIILFASILLNSAAHGQCYFFRLFDNAGDDDFGIRVIPTINSNYIIAGETDAPSPYDSNWVLNIDECGNLIWTKQYTMSPGIGGEEPRAIFQLVDSSFVIFGRQYEFVEDATSCYLLKLSKDGDSLWHRIVDVGYNDWGLAALATWDGGFVGAGTYNEPLPDGHAFLVKTDSVGNIEWQRDYGDSTVKPWVEHMERTLDGNYIISGYLVAGNFFLLKVDTLGNEVFFKTYGDTALLGYGSAVATPDSGYFSVGCISYQNIPQYHGYLIKTDADGNVEWEKTYADTLNMCLVHVAMAHDSNYIITGAYEDTLSGSTFGGRLFLAKLDRQGNTLWDRRISYYGNNSGNYSEDLMVLPNGDILVTGFIIPDDDHFTGIRNQLFVLKADSCGYTEFDSARADFVGSVTGHTASFEFRGEGYCSFTWYFGDGDSTGEMSPSHTYADTGYYYVSLVCRAGGGPDTLTKRIRIRGTVGVDEAEELTAVRVYPNPANDLLVIELEQSKEADLVLYDMVGKVMLKQTIRRGSNTIDVSALAEGLYLYRIGETTGKISVLHVGK